MELTPEGKELYYSVEQGINFLNVGEKNIIEKNDMSNGEITIGAVSHISAFFIMDRIQNAKQDYPNLKINLLTRPTGKALIRSLKNNEIDFAIDSTKMDTIPTLLKKELLLDVKNILISNKPLVIKEEKEISELKLILFFCA